LEQKRSYFSLERIAKELRIPRAEVTQIIEGLLRERAVQWSYNGEKKVFKWVGRPAAGKSSRPKDSGFDLAQRYFDARKGQPPTEKDFE
jgi:hypothetical protein